MNERPIDRIDRIAAAAAARIAALRIAGIDPDPAGDPIAAAAARIAARIAGIDPESGSGYAAEAAAEMAAAAVQSGLRPDPDAAAIWACDAIAGESDLTEEWAAIVAAVSG